MIIMKSIKILSKDVKANDYGTAGQLKDASQTARSTDNAPRQQRRHVNTKNNTDKTGPGGVSQCHGVNHVAI